MVTMKFLLICFLIGFAAATTPNHPKGAWRQNTEYQYRVRGRTVAALHDVSDDYTGVIFRAIVKFQLKSNNNLWAQISNPEYAHIHTSLPDGWMSEIADERLHYKSIQQMTNKPFEIQLKNGIVHGLKVNRDITNWELNLIKSIISQFQVDLQAENIIPSEYNQKPERADETSAHYKTMEDTITGQCETLYDIVPIDEYIYEQTPEIVPLPHLKGNGQIMQIVKTKNYSRCNETVDYHYGLDDFQSQKLYKNYGKMLSKSSVSRIVVSGTWPRHVIQSSFTTNKIIVSPLKYNSQKGIVVSHMNVTLVSVKTAKQEQAQLAASDSSLYEAGNLVYKYNNPFLAVSQTKNENIFWRRMLVADNDDSESSEERRQSMHRFISSAESDNSYSSENVGHVYQYEQESSSLNKPTMNPFLPYFIASNEKAARFEYEFVPAIKKLVHKIAENLREHNKIPERNVLEKFSILTEIIRNTNSNELKQLSDEFYQKREQIDTLKWQIYRDAVAQAATGPALLVVKEWIHTQKIQNEDAAQILSTLINRVSHPSEVFVRTAYELVTSPQVKSQWALNDTAILSFAELVRRVYVDYYNGQIRHPINSNGKQFEHAKYNFLVKEFIPYLAKQLDAAITRNEHRNAQVYIRALGNVAHARVLAVFKPYLEGERHVPQFLRVLMIVAMDQLTQTYTKETRSVLYKTVMNVGDYPQVRVAAVYQLIRTVPPISMLQTLAEHTHYELNTHVRSAISSVIQSASKLTDKYAQVANNAQAVVKLLKPDNYGLQYSKGFFHQYIIKEMNLNYKHYVQSMFAEDSIIPNYLYYSLRANEGDFSRQCMNVAAMVSSITSLTNTVYDHLFENEQPTFEQSPSNMAEQIIKSLNITIDEQEPLQANILATLFGVKRFFAFDNETVAQLPALIHQVYSSLQKGMNVNYTKLYATDDVTISIPTEMSFPFVYSLKRPTFINVAAKMHVNNAQEKSWTMSSKTDISLATSTLSKIGFATPFDHHMYYAGYNQNVQLNLPFTAKFEFNYKNKRVSATVAPLTHDQNQNIFHYSTVPFTTKVDLLQIQTAHDSNYHTIHIGQPRTTENVYGQENGLVYRAKIATEHSTADYSQWQQNVEKYGIFAPIQQLWQEHPIQHNVMELEYAADLSTATHVTFNFNYKNVQRAHQSEHPGQWTSDNSLTNLAPSLQEQSDARQKQVLNRILNNIYNGSANVYDAQIEFASQTPVKYVATFAHGSNIQQNRMQNVLLLSRTQNQQQYQACVSSLTESSNPSPMNFIAALNDNSLIKSWVQIGYGQNCLNGANIRFKVKFDKSEERRRALQTSPMAKLCAQQMKQKMYQHFACANVTAQASQADRCYVEIDYENVGPIAQNVTHKVFNFVRHMGYNYLDENVINATGTQKPNRIEIFAQFEPENYQTINATIKTQHAQFSFHKVPVHRRVSSTFEVRPHHYNPLWNVKKMATYQTEHKPVCVLEQNSANTFNNRTYPVALGHCYHVLLHAGWTDQLRFYNYSYTVLVRDSKSADSTKEVRFVYGYPGNYRQIDFKPNVAERYSSQNPAGKVYINNQEIQIAHDGVYIDQDSKHNVWAQIYALPEGELKIQFSNDLIVYYDGVRVKTQLNEKYHGYVRGLCGAFNGEPSYDLVAPQNCIYHDLRYFVASYRLVKDPSCPASHRDLYEKAMKAPCFNRRVNYTTVITARDAHLHEANSNCNIKVQTRYMIENGGKTICFTTQPQPVCPQGCAASKTVEKTVDVHCQKRSSTTQHYKQQIDNGASPDFSDKTVSKTIKIKLSSSCQNKQEF